MTAARGVLLSVFTVAGMVSSASAARSSDWPTYMGNNQRDGIVAESPALPLSETWIHRAAFAPQPAWPPPASQDFFHGIFAIEDWSVHEKAFQVVAVNDLLFYASPVDHSLCCVDAETGSVRWKFYTEGPVRYAPTVAGGKVYFGSDDGFVYALDTAGKMLWKFRVGPSDRRLPGNGHMISLWPVRTGVLIDQGKGYVAAGVFPEHGIVRCAFDAESGKTLWRTDGEFYNGYMALAGDRLIIPAGRVGPQAFDRRDGKRMQELAGRGSYIAVSGTNVFCQAWLKRSLNFNGIPLPFDLTVCGDDTMFLYGRKEMTAVRRDAFLACSTDKVAANAALRTAQQALSAANKNKDKDPAAVTKANAEVEKLKKRIDKDLSGITNSVVWSKSFEGTNSVTFYSLIMAGDVLFAGRDGAVVAMSARDGSQVWAGEVAGKVYGLAFTRGRLFASTEDGVIHCFKTGSGAKCTEVDLRRLAAPSGQEAGKRVKDILANVPDRRGYALVLGGADASFLVELANATEFKVVAIENDAGKVNALRAALAEKGLQGRISIQQCSGDQLPYPSYFANLVVLNGKTAVSPFEIGRVLQPCGGVVDANGESLEELMKGAMPAGAAFLAAGILKRGALPGAGEWTHQYASPANTACSLDPYVRGEKLLPAWFGDPGPRDMIDRHNRTMAPLVKNGRVFLPANEKIIAVNAYNGVRLWELQVPGSRRVGVLKDSGQMAVSDDALYIVVQDKCWVIDPSTGKHEKTLSIPGENDRKSWGYLAIAGDAILGTIEKTNASFTAHCNMCPILEGDFRPVVMSESIFCLDRRNGAARWHYHGGPVLNSAIAANDKRIFFMESAQPDAVSNLTGRIRVDRFLGGTNRLVSLDLMTGTKVWETSVAFGYQQIVYTQVAGDLVVTTGTYNKTVEKNGKKQALVHYAFNAFAADSGKPVWQAEFPTSMGPGGEHGEQWQHPVIVEGEIFTKYCACDLRTGSPLLEYRGGGPGRCGTWAASASAVFGRGGGLNLDTRKKIDLTKTSREGCFVNLIPADGILSVPHTGAGCTCGYPLELSAGYIAVEPLQPVIHPLHRVFKDKVTVSLTPVIKGWTTRYTLDGSEPTEQSPAYAGPVEVTASVTVKARLWGPAGTTASAGSGVTSASFVKLTPQEPGKSN